MLTGEFWGMKMSHFLPCLMNITRKRRVLGLTISCDLHMSGKSFFLSGSLDQINRKKTKKVRNEFCWL